jgi:hypothetical protein
MESYCFSEGENWLFAATRIQRGHIYELTGAIDLLPGTWDVYLFKDAAKARLFSMDFIHRELETSSILEEVDKFKSFHDGEFVFVPVTKIITGKVSLLGDYRHPQFPVIMQPDGVWWDYEFNDLAAERRSYDGPILFAHYSEKHANIMDRLVFHV